MSLQKTEEQEFRENLLDRFIAYRREEGNGWVDRALAHFEDAVQLIKEHENKPNKSIAHWIEHEAPINNVFGLEKYGLKNGQYVRVDRLLEHIKEKKDVS